MWVEVFFEHIQITCQEVNKWPKSDLDGVGVQLSGEKDNFGLLAKGVEPECKKHEKPVLDLVYFGGDLIA